MIVRVLVIVIALAVAALVGLAYAGLRRHQGTPWSGCVIDGAKGFGGTVTLALLVVGFVWVTNAAADDRAAGPDKPACSAVAAPGG